MAERPIDPIASFLWLFSDDLRKIDPDGRKADEIAQKLRLALWSDDSGYLYDACAEALKNYQKKLKAGL